MIHFIYAIRDAKAEAFLNPFFKPTRAMAERDFENACRDENSMFYMNPEDFGLYEIGQFNVDTGELQPMLVQLIKTGTDYATLSDATQVQ